MTGGSDLHFLDGLEACWVHPRVIDRGIDFARLSPWNAEYGRTRIECFLHGGGAGATITYRAASGDRGGEDDERDPNASGQRQVRLPIQ
jgi:hypothetical protein